MSESHCRKVKIEVQATKKVNIRYNLTIIETTRLFQIQKSFLNCSLLAKETGSFHQEGMVDQRSSHQRGLVRSKVIASDRFN